jgi:amino acid permease
MIKNRYVKIWSTLASLVLDTFLFIISICALVVVIHFENYDHENGHPTDKDDMPCGCASEMLTIVPIIITSLL